MPESNKYTVAYAEDIPQHVSSLLVRPQHMIQGEGGRGSILLTSMTDQAGLANSQLQ